MEVQTISSTFGSSTFGSSLGSQQTFPPEQVLPLDPDLRVKSM